MKNLNHPCIPLIFDIETDDSHVYSIEEYKEGDSLRSLLIRQRLSERDFFNYSIRLCDILFYLHNQNPAIFHLDIKPENIIVNGDELALVDFGCAKLANDNPDRQQNLYGTPGYMAPECRSTIERRTDERADIFSLGCLIAEMLSQTVNMSVKTVRAIKKLGDSCITDRKAGRIQTVEKVRSSLQKLQPDYKKNDTYTYTLREIAIAGTSPGAGTTYTALQLGGYLRQQGRSSIYFEKNSSGMVKKSGEMNSNSIMKDRIYHMFDISMVPLQWESYISCQAMEQLEYRILDYGELTEENVEEFCSADITVLVSGGRPWNMDQLRAGLGIIDFTVFHKTVNCVVNLTDKKLLSGIRACFETEIFNDYVRYYCMPYVPEIVFRNNRKGIKKKTGDMFDEILQN